MIIYDFPLLVKQVRVDTFYYCLMLVLVISQIETPVVFVFNLRIHIVPGVNRSENKLGIWRSQEIEDLFWASALEKAGTGQNTGNIMPTTLEMPYHKW